MTTHATPALTPEEFERRSRQSAGLASAPPARFPRAYRLPERGMPQSVKQALEAHERLVAELSKRVEAVNTARRKIDEAIAHDRQAMADALVNGQPEPKGTVAAARRELERAEGRIDATRDAAGRTARQLTAVVYTARSEWYTALSDERAVDEFTKGLELVRRAAAEIGVIRGTRRWLERIENAHDDLPNASGSDLKVNVGHGVMRNEWQLSALLDRLADALEEPRKLVIRGGHVQAEEDPGVKELLRGFADAR